MRTERRQVTGAFMVGVGPCGAREKSRRQMCKSKVQALLGGAVEDLLSPVRGFGESRRANCPDHNVESGMGPATRRESDAIRP